MRNLRFFLLIAAAMSSAPVVAAESERPGVLPDADKGGEFLDIPGLGRIPMPPGARAFPRGATEAPSQPRASAPPPVERAPPETREQALDRLVARLAAAQDREEGAAIAVKVLRAFAHTPSDTIALLVERAERAQDAGAPLIAKALLDQVTLLAPGWAEGFVRRGRVREELGDRDNALADLQTATTLEPRRFDAFALIGVYAEDSGDKKRALEAFRRSLALDPTQEPVRQAHDRLKLEVDGRDI